MYAKFAARTPGIGNTAGGLLADSRSLALPGSKDCNRGSATPSDARGLQAYHCKPAPGRGKAARRGRLGDGSNRSVRSLTSARPGAPSRVARWGRNVPAVLGMKLSRLRDIASYEPKSWRIDWMIRRFSSDKVGKS